MEQAGEQGDKKQKGGMEGEKQKETQISECIVVIY